jgi:hypothetical protein
MYFVRMVEVEETFGRTSTNSASYSSSGSKWSISTSGWRSSPYSETFA